MSILAIMMLIMMIKNGLNAYDEENGPMRGTHSHAHAHTHIQMWGTHGMDSPISSYTPCTHPTDS